MRAPVLLQLREDGPQRGADEVGRAEGHNGADVLHGDAVVM